MNGHGFGEAHVTDVLGIQGMQQGTPTVANLDQSAGQAFTLPGELYRAGIRQMFALPGDGGFD